MPKYRSWVIRFSTNLSVKFPVSALRPQSAKVLRSMCVCVCVWVRDHRCPSHICLPSLCVITASHIPRRCLLWLCRNHGALFFFLFFHATETRRGKVSLVVCDNAGGVSGRLRRSRELCCCRDKTNKVSAIQKMARAQEGQVKLIPLEKQSAVSLGSC